MSDATALAERILLSWLELVEITGYKRARDQAAWIREHYAIPAFVNGAGNAVVARHHFLNAQQTQPRKTGKVRIIRGGKAA